MAHGYFSIFTEHAVKQQRSFAHTASTDKIEHGTLTLLTIISLSAADRSLELTCPGLAEPSSRLACMMQFSWSVSEILTLCLCSQVLK